MKEFSWPKGIRGIFFFTLLLALFFGYEINIRTFADPDEGRYVEIPREMVVSNDYVTPRLNGLKYFEKPAFFYWLQASSIKAFGINETSMRLWPLIFAVLGSLALFFVGRICFSDSVGLISASILSTNILYYMHSRLIILDLAVSSLLSLSLFSFFLAFVHPIKKFSKHLLICLFYIFCALSLLTKGLIGVVLPGLVVFLWMIFYKKLYIIREMLYLPGFFLFFLIAVPWHFVIAQKNPEFLHFYFIVEHFLRYTTTLHCRYQPVYFFIPILLLGLMPWTGFAIVAIKNSIKKIFQNNNKEHAFLMIWFFSIFVFFSFAGSKLIPYILPVLYPLALSSGIFISEINDRDYKISVFFTFLSFITLFFVYIFFKPSISNILAHEGVTSLFYMFFALSFVAILVLLSAFFKKNFKGIAILLFISLSINMMWIFNKSSAYYQEVKRPTTKYMAEFVNLNKKDEDLVFCYRRYYQDFPVYLNSTVFLVDFVGELEFGMNAEPNKKVIYKKDEFFKLWAEKSKRIFLLTSKKDYKELFLEKNYNHMLLNYDGNFVLLSNK